MQNEEKSFRENRFVCKELHFCCSLISIVIFQLIGLGCLTGQTPELNFDNAKQSFAARDLATARHEFAALHKAGVNAAQSRYYLGRIALLEGKPLEAIIWLEPLAAVDPPVLDALDQLTKAYFDAGQLAKAEASATLALRRSPWDGALQYRLGRIYQQLGDAGKARQAFAASALLKSADRQSVQTIAECSRLLAAGAKDDSLLLSKPLLLNPTLDPDVLVALGLTYISAGFEAEALDYFHAAAEHDPNFFQAQYNSGLALLKLNRRSDAIPFLGRARELNAASVEANAALALAFVLEGRFGDAVGPLQSWLTQTPKNPRALNMLGLCYLRTGEAKRAVSLLRESLQLTQDDPKTYLVLIEASNATEQQEQGLAAASEAVARFPDAAQVHLAKGQQLARLGRYREAGSSFARAAELSPGQSDALLGLAESQQKQGDYAGSLGTYRRVLAVNAQEIAAQLGVARNLVSLSKLDEARTFAENAVRAHPSEPQVHFELSRIYARLGEKELAAQEARAVALLRDTEGKGR